MSENIYLKTAKIFLVFLLLFSFVTNVEALSSGELQQQKDQKEKELNDINKAILDAQAKIANLKKSQTTNLSELEKLKNQIAQLDLQLQINDEEVKKINTDLSLKNLELDSIKRQKIEKIKGLYKLNKVESLISRIVNNIGDLSSVYKRYKYVNNIVLKDNQNLELLESQRLDLTQKQSGLNDQIKQKSDENTALKKQKSDIEATISNLNNQISSNTKKQNDLRSQASSVQTLIDQLSEEQRKALEKEQGQIESSGNNSCSAKINNEPLVSQEYYIAGRGRDLFDGHAVGLSQMGIYGGALKGWDYKTLLQKYYTGAQIGGDYSYLKVRVSGYGEMDLERYVSGLGEVSDYACETPSNIGKPYVRKDSSKSNIYDCWPEEAVKAQIVAARSYVVSYILKNPSYSSIPTSSAFQVYKGGTLKSWASEATKGQVVLVNGSPVSAYYSANSRGHTEDSNLVWTKSYSTSSINALKGSNVSYAKGIDDSSWLLMTNCTTYKWRTNSFTLEKLSQILSRDTSTNVGNITSITMHQGSSPRIWAVTLVGSNGTKYVSGWKFKSVFNDWVYNTYTADKRAFLFSTEFTLNKAP